MLPNTNSTRYESKGYALVLELSLRNQVKLTYRHVPDVIND